MRNALPDYFKPVVTFAYYTGWRKEEILSLNGIRLTTARRVRWKWARPRTMTAG